MPGSLRWVVAFLPEAAPIIEHFQLRKMDRGAGPFPVYGSPDGKVSLVLSGKGKLNAAAATAALAAVSEDARAAWINFGIAGAGTNDYGNVFLASRVTDHSSGRNWFPVSCVGPKCEPARRYVRTIDDPSGNYPEDGSLLEMEAAGFYPIALKCNSAEFCHVVKVVSDDPGHLIEQVTPKIAGALCATALHCFLPWLASLRELVEDEMGRAAVPAAAAELLDRFHFTETQQHQLKRLLRFWYARFSDAPEKLNGLVDCCTNSRDVVLSLKKVLYESDL